MRTSLIINNLNAVKRKVTGQSIPNNEEKNPLPQGIQVIGDQKLLARVKLYQMRLEMNIDNAKIGIESSISPIFFNALADHMNPEREKKAINELTQSEMVRVLEYAGNLPQNEFLKILLQTQPITFEATPPNQWNKIESELISNASMAATVTVFKEDLTKNKNGDDIPFQAQVLFTNPNFEPAKFSPTDAEKNAAEKKDQATASADAANSRAAMDSRLEAYFNQRVLPLLNHANQVAGNNQKKALVAVPALIFSEIKDTLGKEYDQKALNAVVRMIEKEASKLSNVQGVYLEMEGTPEKKSAGHVAILMQKDHPGVNTLSHPSEYGSQFKQCQLFKVIEGNAFKYGVEQLQPTNEEESKQDLTGHDAIIQRRNQSYAVVQQATNLLALTTANVAEGHFNPTSSRFEPIAKNGKPVTDWNDLIQKNKPSTTIGSVQEQKEEVHLAQSVQIAKLAASEFKADLDSKKQDRSLTGQSKETLNRVLNTFELMSKRLSTYLNREDQPDVKIDKVEKNRTLVALTDLYKEIRHEMNEKIQELKQSLQQKLNANSGKKETINRLYEGEEQKDHTSAKWESNSLHTPPRQRS